MVADRAFLFSFKKLLVEVVQLFVILCILNQRAKLLSVLLHVCGNRTLLYKGQREVDGLLEDLFLLLLEDDVVEQMHYYYYTINY